MSLLDDEPIQTLRNLRKTYLDMGLNRSLFKTIPIPEFQSADDFGARTESFKGSLISIDTVKGRILVKDRNDVNRVIIGNFD